MENTQQSILNEKTYTIKELAEVLKCTPQTIRNYIKANKINAIKLDRKVYITETAVNDFLKRNAKII